MPLFKSKRQTFLFLIDFVIMLAVYALAFLVSVFQTPNDGLRLDPFGYVLNALAFVVCLFAARIAVKCYSNVWRYANSVSFLRLMVADAIGGIVAVTVTHFIAYVNIGFWMGCSFVTMANM